MALFRRSDAADSGSFATAYAVFDAVEPSSVDISFAVDVEFAPDAALGGVAELEAESLADSSVAEC